eukprot:5063140-Alexandrium_andersonii.AAC.1
MYMYVLFAQGDWFGMGESSFNTSQWMRAGRNTTGAVWTRAPCCNARMHARLNASMKLSMRAQSSTVRYTT